MTIWNKTTWNMTTWNKAIWKMTTFRALIGFIITLLVLVGSTDCKTTKHEWRIGFFEGGEYQGHNELRQQLYEQIGPLLPEGYKAEFPPEGFKSAGWKRDTCRMMAEELAADKSIDLVFAFGPWTVEDLLAAGFDRPIVAVFRFDPVAEGIADSLGRPIAENLTVRIRPGKIASDLSLLTSLKDIRQLGVIYFASNDERDKVVDEISKVGQQLGFSVVSGVGYDRAGTFAVFNAYKDLPQSVDAVYMTPLWGTTPSQIRQFYRMVLSDRRVAFSSEGEFQTSRGAAAAASGESARTAARLQAWKAAKIIQGATPADLPTVIAEQPGVHVNEFVARAAGIKLSDDLLLHADVIEAAESENLERFTLSSAMNRAVTQNPGYQSKYDALDAASAQAKQAWSEYLPQLSAAASWRIVNDNGVDNDRALYYDNDQFRAGLKLEQQVLSLPSIRDIQIAAADREQVRNDLKQATLDLELGVSLAFINYVRAMQVRQVQMMYRRQVEEAMHVARMKMKLEDGPAGDLERLEHEWLRASREVVEAQSNLDVARILFNNMLGRPGNLKFAVNAEVLSNRQLIMQAGRWDALHQAEVPYDTIHQALAAAASEVNPDMQRNMVGLKLKQLEIKRNSGGFWPKLGLYATLDAVDERQDVIGYQEQSPVMSFGVKAELPLFLGGGRFSERAKLKAAFSEQEYLRDETALQVSNDIRVYLRRAIDMATAFPSVEHSLELSSTYSELVHAQFNTNQRSIAELLDALENERESSLEAVNLQFGYFEVVAKLVHEIGWSVSDSGRTPADELFVHLRDLMPTQQ